MLFLVILLFVLYFAPTIIGFARAVPNIGSVVVVNFFLGWTFIGWVVAMAMAARSRVAETQVQVVQQVGLPEPPQLSAEDPETDQLPPPS